MCVDEMSRLRGRVAERGVDLATEQKLASFQQQWTIEMQSMQSQMLSLVTRLDEVTSRNSATSTAVFELYCLLCVSLAGDLWRGDVAPTQNGVLGTFKSVNFIVFWAS